MKTERINIIDILRGFALIGILFANIPGIARLQIASPADEQMYRFISLAFEQRFFPIFSFLFGLGFFIFMRNAETKGHAPFSLMMRRLGLLILFGIVHQFLQPGEALLIYGILGFFLLPVYNKSPKVILSISFAMLLLGIFISEYFIILAMFFLGMFIGKIDYFENRAQYQIQTRSVWLINIIAIAPSLWAQEHWHATIHSGTFQSLAGLAIASALVTTLLLWSKTELVLKSLAAFGRMALTNYIMQSVIVLAIAMLAGGYGSLPLRIVPLIWIIVFPIQIIISNLWMRRFNYGPLEWLWRWGTYGRKPLFQKKSGEANDR